MIIKNKFDFVYLINLYMCIIKNIWLFLRIKLKLI